MPITRSVVGGEGTDMATASEERRSDVGDGAFEPWPAASVHVEWGHTGAALAAERGDLCVIVDVLSFSTTMAIATEAGGVALAYSGAELDAMGGPSSAERQLRAVVIGKERAFVPGRYTLSPASLRSVSAGERIVFTSLNGAASTAAAEASPEVLIGSLRNRTATAAAVAAHLRDTTAARCTIVACGEQWTSHSSHSGLRPAAEDWLGAGAIARELRNAGFDLSVEAELAASAFDQASAHLARMLSECVSGRELIERGFAEDVALAAEIDASTRTVRRTADRTERAFAATAPL
jgi:2-phosphosulfolactate phosphatase